MNPLSYLRNICLALLVLVSYQPLPAQVGFTLQGQITDPSGSSVPKTVVTVLQGKTVVRTSQTNDQGRYQIPNLPIGTYTIRALAKGFALYEGTTLGTAIDGVQTLDVRLNLRVETERVEVNDTNKSLDLNAEGNAGALVLRGKDLDSLSDDRTDLAADLQALAGPAMGPNGGQIFIDGFTGGRIPPKQSIREVRINANPFAAQFDRPGQGRIEIFTKPGADEFHGEVQFHFSDAFLNSRNPFVAVKPPYQRRQWEGEITGPIRKNTSFFWDFERRDVSENSFINALTLNNNLEVTPLAAAVVAPVTGVESNFKVDHRLSANHTLAARFGENRDGRDAQGVGGFSLASRGSQVRDTEETFQLIETGVLNARTINETRFRYRRQRSRQNGENAAQSISVLDAFTSGGAGFLSSYTNQDRYELQNFTSLVTGNHVTRWGGLVRSAFVTDQTTQNYPGTFTFTSLANYRSTLLGLQQGLSPAAIRASGGGASQYSVAAGNPVASIHQTDLGLFVQDDWRVRPNFTLNAGLRYEWQTNVHDWRDVSPRLGFAWALGGAKGKGPALVIRGGSGIFYDRLNESLSLDALRLDGIRQQQFLVPFPNFFPLAPSIASLTGSQQPQAIRRIESGLRAPMMIQTAFGVERQLAKGVTIATNFIYARGTHALRSRNINAPLPVSGLHPFGGVNNIYLYESSGVYRQRQLITNINAKVNAKLSFTGFYALSKAISNTDGAGTFPADQYDLTAETGRAAFDIRHRVQLTAAIVTRWGIRISPFFTATSGRPYNITLGQDFNGDSLFTDRPPFVPFEGHVSIRQGDFGLDTARKSVQNVIPRNSGQGPNLVAANLRVSKTFTLGKSTDDSAGKKASADPKQITFTLAARNALNHPNYGTPVGNLSSLLFGRSTALSSGTGGGAAGNRRLDLQVKFSF